jgi:hypothetical protein
MHILMSARFTAGSFTLGGAEDAVLDNTYTGFALLDEKIGTCEYPFFAKFTHTLRFNVIKGIL